MLCNCGAPDCPRCYPYVNINICIWSYDHDIDCWGTSCGNEFCITEGTPAENNMKYCTFCARKIREEMKKTYTITLENEDGTLSMKRVNDGFTAPELIGILEMAQLDIMKMIADGIQPDKIERQIMI